MEAGHLQRDGSGLLAAGVQRPLAALLSLNMDSKKVGCTPEQDSASCRQRSVSAGDSGQAVGRSSIMDTCRFPRTRLEESPSHGVSGTGLEVSSTAVRPPVCCLRADHNSDAFATKSALSRKCTLWEGLLLWKLWLFFIYKMK